MITLAQTLSGDWVVTTPNPEEDGWSTELARFETGSATAPHSPARAALEMAAAFAAVTSALGGEKIVVRSHDSEARANMERRVQEAKVR